MCDCFFMNDREKAFRPFQGGLVWLFPGRERRVMGKNVGKMFLKKSRSAKRHGLLPKRIAPGPDRHPKAEIFGKAGLSVSFFDTLRRTGDHGFNERGPTAHDRRGRQHGLGICQPFHESVDLTLAGTNGKRWRGIAQATIADTGKISRGRARDHQRVGFLKNGEDFPGFMLGPP